MELANIYGGNPAPVVQAVSQPASPANDTSPKPGAMAGNHSAFTWLGFLIAAVLLRVVYEMAD